MLSLTLSLQNMIEKSLLFASIIIIITKISLEVEGCYQTILYVCMHSSLGPKACKNGQLQHDYLFIAIYNSYYSRTDMYNYT